MCVCVCVCVICVCVFVCVCVCVCVRACVRSHKNIIIINNNNNTHTRARARAHAHRYIIFLQITQTVRNQKITHRKVINKLANPSFHQLKKAATTFNRLEPTSSSGARHRHSSRRAVPYQRGNIRAERCERGFYNCRYLHKAGIEIPSNRDRSHYSEHVRLARRATERSVS